MAAFRVNVSQSVASPAKPRSRRSTCTPKPPRSAARAASDPSTKTAEPLMDRFAGIRKMGGGLGGWGGGEGGGAQCRLGSVAPDPHKPSVASSGGGFGHAGPHIPERA
eukprot:353602-Prymnesium_polylepis.1